MSPRLRTILFLTFLFAFLISAPLLVLYTAGYRLDLTHGRIVHTAVLNITSTPRNATVYIDDEAESDRTPAVIDTILPGERFVELTKDGYLSWSKTLPFESRSTVFVNNVVLFLDTQLEQVQEIELMTMSVSPDGTRLVYLTQESSWIEVWSTQGSSQSTTLLMRLPYVSWNNYQMSWSPDGNMVVLDQISGSLHTLTITSIEGELFELDLPSDILDFWWDQGGKNTLFVATSDGVERLSSNTAEQLVYEADGVTSSADQEIFVYNTHDRTVLSIWEGESASIITYLPLGDYRFSQSPDGLVLLHDTQRDRIVLVETNDQEQPILLNEEATDWRWNTDKNRLLYTSGFDLKLYDRSEHSTKTLIRLSEPIEAFAWYPEGGVVLYAENGLVRALELDDRDVASQTELAELVRGLFWMDENGEVLYLIDEVDSGYVIWQRQLQR